MIELTPCRGKFVSTEIVPENRESKVLNTLNIVKSFFFWA